jgi:hypothetical protein
LLFEDKKRVDKSPHQFGESYFDFLNRSGTLYFGAVRQLTEDWLNEVEPRARASLEGSLRADNHDFQSAFWELYLHEAYRRSGYSIDIHPQVPGSSNRPDFLLEKLGERFYLEAVKVGEDRQSLAEKQRLEEVQRILSELRVKNFSLVFLYHEIGPAPLSTKPLRAKLKTWLASLNPDQITSSVGAAAAPLASGLFPQFMWKDAGWKLEFHAVPIKASARSQEHRALGMTAAGEASIVDDTTGILRVLSDKASRYGRLDAPLVLAVLSNQGFPTDDYQVENALYGVSPHRPPDSATRLGDLVKEGFWLTKKGWRYGHVPQVISATGLLPWTVGQVQPRLWRTLEPGIGEPFQPTWLAHMDVTTLHPSEHFGLPYPWPAEEVDFD